jgi:hypothetical protein
MNIEITQDEHSVLTDLLSVAQLEHLPEPPNLDGALGRLARHRYELEKTCIDRLIEKLTRAGVGL